MFGRAEASRHNRVNQWPSGSAQRTEREIGTGLAPDVQVFKLCAKSVGWFAHWWMLCTSACRSSVDISAAHAQVRSLLSNVAVNSSASQMKSLTSLGRFILVAPCVL